MIEIAKTYVAGWDSAIRGMRNALNSWDKMDSKWSVDESDREKYVEVPSNVGTPYYVGPNDQQLMRKLAKAGTDHRKFMRMIVVWVDVNAPLYWWKQASTYQVGTVKNSCSTMHKIASRDFVIDDFSHEHLDTETPNLFICRHSQSDSDMLENVSMSAEDLLYLTIDMLNYYRRLYVKTKDKHYWWQLVQLLPDTYNQKRTFCLNYEVLANMYGSRRNHKLDEWHTFCHWIEGLPMSDLCCNNE